MILSQFCFLGIFVSNCAICLANACHPGAVRECLSRFDEIVAKCGADVDCQCDALWVSGVPCFSSCPVEATDEFVKTFINGKCQEFAWKWHSPIPSSSDHAGSERPTSRALESYFSVHENSPLPSFVATSTCVSCQSLFEPANLTTSLARVEAQNLVESEEPSQTHSKDSAEFYGPKLKRLLGMLSERDIEPRALSTATRTSTLKMSNASSEAANYNISAAVTAFADSNRTTAAPISSASSALSPVTPNTSPTSTTLSPEEDSRRKQLQRLKENLKSIRASRAHESSLAAAAAAAAAATATPNPADERAITEAMSDVSKASDSPEKLGPASQHEIHESAALDHFQTYLLWLSAALIMLYLGSPIYAVIALIGLAVRSFLRS